MRGRSVASADIEECHQCSGLFVPRSVVMQLIKERDSTTADAFVATFGNVPPLDVGQRPVTYLRCPACNGLMNPTQFAKGAKVIIDICGSKCGLWFDVGEFARVISFVMAGGLERAAQRIATERAKDEAAQGRHGAKIISERSGFTSSTASASTPLTPRNTAAIWSVFEALVKPPAKRRRR